jgi:hypothetical protein
MTCVTANVRGLRYAVVVSGHAVDGRLIFRNYAGGPNNMGKGDDPMFDSLQEQIRSTEMEKRTISQQVLRVAVVVAASIAVFGGVYLAVMLLEY